MKNAILKIREIEIDEKLYPRNEFIENVAKEYADAMNSGEAFPPIYVALYKKKYLLVDGRHRVEANKIRGERYIQCNIKDNFPDEGSIYLAAVRANLRHGVRFGKQDKIKIGYTLKQMGYDTGDISKLTGLTVKKIEKVILPKLGKITVTSKVKKGKYPRVIKERIRQKEPINILSRKEEAFINETNKAEWQILKLQETLNYIKTEKIDVENKKVCNLITRIKHWLKKKYPKL